MTVAFVQKSDGLTTTSTASLTLTGVGAGALLLVLSAAYRGNTTTPSISSISSSPSLTWARAAGGVGRNVTGSDRICEDLWYAQNATAGSYSVTVTYASNVGGNLTLAEFSGVATTGALDVGATNSGDAGTPTSGTTATTTQASALVVAGFGASSPTDSAIGLATPSGYTNVSRDQDATSYAARSLDYKLVSATGTQSATWSPVGSDVVWSSSIAVFKAATGGGTTYNDTITESVAAGEAVTGTKITAGTASDSVAGGAAGIAVAATVQPSLSDSVAGGAAGVAAAATVQPSLTDSVTAGEAVTGTTGAPVIDSVTAGEAVSATATARPSLTDSVAGGAAGIAAAATVRPSLSDSVTAGDAVTGDVGSPAAPISFVQSAAVVTGTSTASLSLTGVGAGALLVVQSAAWRGNTTVPAISAISSTPALTWARAAGGVGITTDGNDRNAGDLWYAQNAAAGNYTVTVSYPVAVGGNLVLAEFAGVATVGALDVGASNTGTGGTPTSGTTALTAQANALVLGFFSASSPTDAGCGLTTPGGFTNVSRDQDPYAFAARSLDYKVVSALGTQTVAWNALRSDIFWSTGVAVFKAAAGSGGVAYSASIADSLTATDASTGTIQPPSISDAVLALDSVTSTVVSGLNRAIADSVAAGDASSVGLTAQPSLSDSLAAADAVTVGTGQWEPAALGAALVFAGDTNRTASALADASEYRDLYIPTRKFVAPVSNRGSINPAGGVSGTRRVLTMGAGTAFRAQAAAFPELAAIFSGLFSATNGTVVMAVQLNPAADIASPTVFLDSGPSQWIGFYRRGTASLEFRGRTVETENVPSILTGNYTGWHLITGIKSGPTLTLRIDRVAAPGATLAPAAGTAMTVTDVLLVGGDPLPDGTIDTTVSDGVDAIAGILYANVALSGADLIAAENWVAATAGLIEPVSDRLVLTDAASSSVVSGTTKNASDSLTAGGSVLGAVTARPSLADSLAAADSVAAAIINPGWQPSALAGALIFVADANNPASLLADGSEWRDLYTPSKTMIAPPGARGTVTAGDAQATGHRVLALTTGKYLRANGSAFAALTNAFNGPWASNSATIVIASKLPADDTDAEPAVWVSADGFQWVDFLTRIDRTVGRIHDNVDGTGNNGRTDGDFSVRAIGGFPGWRLFTFIKSGPTLELRIDGVSQGTATYTGSQSFTAADFLINATLEQGTGALAAITNVLAVAGIIVTSGALAGADLINAENWVAATAGLVSPTSDVVTASDAAATQLELRPAASDNLTAGDAATAGQPGFAVAVADSLTATDATTGLSGPTISDAPGSVAAGDAASATVGTLQAVADPLAAGDAATPTITVRPALAEALAAVDVLVAQATVRPSVTDSLAATGGDSVTASPAQAATISDSATAGDASAPQLGASGVIADVLTGIDAAASTQALGAVAADGLGAGDAAAVLPGTVSASLTEAAALAEAVTAIKLTSAAVADSLAGGDAAATLAATYAMAVADAVTANEVPPAVSLTGAATVSDAASAGGDLATTALSTSAASSDPASAADLVAAGLLQSGAVADSAGTTDAAALTGGTYSLEAADAATAADAAAAQRSTAGAATDGLLAADAALVAPSTLTVAVAEPASVTDAAAGGLLLTATLAESVATADAAGAAAPALFLTIAEAVTGNDDPPSATQTAGAAATQAASAGDAAVTAMVMTGAVAEPATSGDAASASLIPAPSELVTDSAAAGDAAAAAATLGASLTDAAGLADAAGYAAVVGVSVSDSLTAADAAQPAVRWDLFLVEELVGGDALGSTAVLRPSLLETLAGNDGAGLGLAFAPTVTEAVAAGDAAGNTASLRAAVAETLTAADSQLAAVAFVASLFEGVTAAELIRPGVIAARSLAEAVVAADATSAFVSQGRARLLAADGLAARLLLRDDLAGRYRQGSA